MGYAAMRVRPARHNVFDRIVQELRDLRSDTTGCLPFQQFRGGRRVDDTHDGPYAREPRIEDLVRICRALNEAGARYILIGGFAVIAHGGARTTKDIDLPVDASPENVARVKGGLRSRSLTFVLGGNEQDILRLKMQRCGSRLFVGHRDASDRDVRGYPGSARRRPARSRRSVLPDSYQFGLRSRFEVSQAFFYPNPGRA